MGSKKNSVPERWEIYTAIGKQVPNTRFLPFKVPLRQPICKKSGESFSPDKLLEAHPNLQLIVDLTNTNDGRYYYTDTFKKCGVNVVKIKCRGGPGILPSPELLQRFYKTVDSFLEKTRNETSLIGVHCTHGLNRTGYFICKYMVNRLGIDPCRAIDYFQDARGHIIERPLLINDILNKTSEKKTYVQSPLTNCYEDEVPSSSRYARHYLSWRTK